MTTGTKYTTALVVLSLILLACEAIDRPSAGHALSALEIGEAVRAERDALLSRLTEGTILYEKQERIDPGAMKGYPTHTIDESWTIMADEGSIGAKVLQSHDLDGNLIQNSIQIVDPEAYAFANIETSFYIWFTERHPVWPLENMWFMPLRVEEKDFPVVGPGYLNGRPSTVFEYSEAGDRPYRMEVELVNDSPLLHRMSSYEDSELISEITLLEYRVLGGIEEGE